MTENLETARGVTMAKKPDQFGVAAVCNFMLNIGEIHAESCVIQNWRTAELMTTLSTTKLCGTQCWKNVTLPECFHLEDRT